jgi:chitodextrinase
MTRRHILNISTRAITIVLLFALMLGVLPVSATPPDRTPPTTPRNLRVTGMTPYSVSLAWTPSTDNSGNFRYVICCANVSSQSVNAPASSFTYTAGLEANRSFTLRIVAVDAAGNYSGYSNSVTFTLPRDTTPPSKPAVSIADVGPTHVSLAWSSTEDGPNVWFTVSMNGSPISQGTKNTSGTFTGLQPQTAYTFTVQARDFGGNVSPLSDPVTVTTEPSNPNDVTPPTVPTNLREQHFGDGEIHLDWTQSTDDFTEQRFIKYNVYVNDVLSDMPVGSGRSIVYNNGGNIVHIAVTVVDEAGNESAPATITIDMNQP